MEASSGEKQGKRGGIGMGLMLPATFVVAWVLALTGTDPDASTDPIDLGPRGRTVHFTQA